MNEQRYMDKQNIKTPTIEIYYGYDSICVCQLGYF